LGKWYNLLFARNERLICDLYGIDCRAYIQKTGAMKNVNYKSEWLFLYWDEPVFINSKKPEEDADSNSKTTGE